MKKKIVKPAPKPAPKTVKEAKPAPKKVRLVNESKPLAEGITPKADKLPAGGNCKNPACTHADALHYGSAKRWCNGSGCQCQEFK